MSDPISIYLGPNDCSIGIYKNGKPEIIQFDNKQRTIPYIISFKNNKILIGNDAKKIMNENLKNTVYGLREIIGKNYDDEEVQKFIKKVNFIIEEDSNTNKPIIIIENKGEKKRYFIEEIYSMIFDEIIKKTKQYLKQDVKNIILTIPSYFNDSQTNIIKNLVKKNGLNILKIINEAIAACYAYNLDDDKKPKKILVLYMGSNETNINILFFNGYSFKVKANEKNDNLGGKFFDEKLYDYCLKKLHEDTNIEFEENISLKNKLMNQCERLKIDLSYVEESEFDIDYYNYRITIEEFENMCHHLFQKLIKLIKNILNKLNLKKNDIDEIILAGGTTNIPKIKKIIKQYFNGKEVKTNINPKETYIIGATMQIPILNKFDDEKSEELKTTSLSLGIDKGYGIMQIIIPRNSTIPIEETITLKSINNSSFNCKIYEGERELVKYNNFLGECMLNINSQKRKTDEIEIEINFKIEEKDNNFYIFVTVKEKDIDNKNDVKIPYNLRRSIEEIEKLIKEKEKYEEKDKKDIEKIEELKYQKYSIGIYFGYESSKIGTINDKNEFIPFLSNGKDTISTNIIKKENDYFIDDKNQYENKDIIIIKNIRNLLNDIININEEDISNNGYYIIMNKDINKREIKFDNNERIKITKIIELYIEQLIKRFEVDIRYIENIVITIPFYFDSNDSQKSIISNILKKIWKNDNLSLEVSFIEEPIAAIYTILFNYNLNVKQIGKNILVFAFYDDCIDISCIIMENEIVYDIKYKENIKQMKLRIDNTKQKNKKKYLLTKRINYNLLEINKDLCNYCENCLYKTGLEKNQIDKIILIETKINNENESKYKKFMEMYFIDEKKKEDSKIIFLNYSEAFIEVVTKYSKFYNKNIIHNNLINRLKSLISEKKIIEKKLYKYQQMLKEEKNEKKGLRNYIAKLENEKKQLEIQIEQLKNENKGLKIQLKNNENEKNELKRFMSNIMESFTEQMKSFNNRLNDMENSFNNRMNTMENSFNNRMNTMESTFRSNNNTEESYNRKTKKFGNIIQTKDYVTVQDKKKKENNFFGPFPLKKI